MDVLLVKLEFSFEKSKYKFLCNFVEESTIERINKFIDYNDSLRTVFGELVLKKNLTETKGSKFKPIRFYKNEFGKPYIIGRSHIFFNISHSGKYVVCAIDDSELGIDIEYIKEIDLSIAKRFFSKCEYDYFCSKKDLNMLSRFYDVWTMKESYIKAIGLGLSKNLDSFSVVNEFGLNQVYENKEFTNWYVHSIDVSPKYKIALCSTKRALHYSLKVITVDEIYNYFKSLS